MGSETLQCNIVPDRDPCVWAQKHYNVTSCLTGILVCMGSETLQCNIVPDRDPCVYGLKRHYNVTSCLTGILVYGFRDITM